MFLWRWCLGTLKDLFGLNMPIVLHAIEVCYLRRLLRQAQSVDVTSEYRRIDLCCFDDLIDGFYLVKGADAWQHELEFENWQQYHAHSPRFVR